jgi:hypothetical protein
MIVTPRFIFLHLHKSGGTFVNELLIRFLPGAQQLGYHLPWRKLPDAYIHLPVLGLVRNPWSYYVSWYAFQSQRPQPNALFRVLSEGGRLDFTGTIRNMLNLGTTGVHLDEIIAALPQAYTNQGLNLPGFALQPIRGSGLGFYSFLYRYMYGGAARLHVARMEALREELESLLSAVGQPVSEAIRAYIQSAPARNVSSHGTYTDYYNDELRDLVAERDADVITKYGYRFGE